MKVCFKDWANITRGIKDFSIRKRLNILIYVCCVPFVIIIAYLLITLDQVSQRYDGVVENIAKANAYNIDFKEDFDYTMYIIVVNSERASKLINMQEPFALINETRNVFEDLYRIAETKEAQNRLSRILKTLNTLEARAQEIVTDAKVSGNYDKNLERLDLNVRILTEIIQEQIQQYIYYETTNLNLIREGISHGIKNKRGFGKIRVTGEIVDNHILFKVSDNGIGMNQQRLEDVRSMLIKEKKSSDSDSGFGLFNVAQRLKLNYGDAYGLTLYSTYGEGTCAEVLIPKILIPRIEGSVVK